jgi:RNA polymerase-associated protein CTR9
MLGIDYINQSKDATKQDEERAAAYAAGTRHVQKSFKTNNKGAAAANALSEFFFRKGDLANVSCLASVVSLIHNLKALKLAERTVQYADTMTLLTEGNYRVAKVHHSEGNHQLASKHYQQAADSQQKHLLSSLGLAQMNLQSNEIAAAIHRLDGMSAPSSKSTCLEASIMLASLRTNPRPGVSSTDIANDKKRSREIFDFIARTIDANENQVNEGKFSRNIRNLGDDKDMWIEIARLWQQENPEKTERALKEALRIVESNGQTEPRIVNNLAVLRHLEGDLELARTMYEDSLASLSSSSEIQMEEVSTTILYNLARVYEAQDNYDLAREAYTKLLSRHPEYVDGNSLLSDVTSGNLLYSEN